MKVWVNTSLRRYEHYLGKVDTKKNMMKSISCMKTLLEGRGTISSWGWAREEHHFSMGIAACLVTSERNISDTSVVLGPD